MKKSELKGNKAGQTFEFSDKEVKSVQVRSGAWIDGVGVNHNKYAGGPGGGLKNFELDQDDYITKLRIKFGSRHLGQIIVETYKNKKFIAGPSTGGNHTHASSHVFEVGEKEAITGFLGTHENYLNSLGVIIQELPEIKDTEGFGDPLGGIENKMKGF